jgi:outer membrane murein-binding lipoprotein Lpp
MPTIKPFIGFVLTISIALGVSGCDSSSSSGGASMDQMAGAVDAQNAAQKQAAEAVARKAEEDRIAAEKAAAAKPAEPERKLAGREAVAPGGGYYKAIIGARRHVLNQADRLPWLQAVQHFQATEGRLPKDHNEFMKKIVEPLEINLGYKEENQEFLYDPHEGQWGEVFVVAKEPAGPPAGAAPNAAAK